MSRIVLLFALCLLALPAEGGSSSEMSNKADEKLDPTKKLGSVICYDLIPCLNLTEPWTGPLRPFPVPMSPDEQPVRFLFFSQPDIKKEYEVTVVPNINIEKAPFDESKPTVIITHGFANNGTAKWMHDLKDAYLSKVNANVMLTDWGPGAQNHNYLQAASNTIVVALLIAKVLNELRNDYGLEMSNVHLIGHSLGAQISALVGKEMPGIGRLTALDPAQPGFEGYDKRVRLDKTDAEFVDVIHTDAKPFIPTLGFGMVKPHGHVDFYVNGGFEQPGCIVPDNLPKVTSLLDLAKLPVEYLSEIKSCNHGRAHQYLIEAFNETDNCIIWGHRATASEIARTVAHSLTQALLSEYTALSPTCTKEDCVPLGFATKNSPLRGVFVVTTNKESPYCISETGVPPEDETSSDTRPKTSIGKAADFAKKTIGRVGERIKGIVPFV